MLSADQAKGLALACSSAFFIGSSFIIKKKGLRVAGANGIRAGSTPHLLCLLAILACPYEVIAVRLQCMT